jgi:hypothetical protein
MDLNHLYFRHQIALMSAAGTRDFGQRDSHLQAADGLSRLIARIQKRLGATAAPLALAGREHRS